MILLITPQEFSTYKDISKKRDEGKINDCIKDAQQVDLYDVLGDFYFDVLKNKEEASYKQLMDGGVFTINNEEYRHDGIKSILSDYTYTRYLYLINTNHTPFGLQQKYSQDSKAVDRNTIRDIVKQTQQDASIKFKMIDKYLLANRTLFPRYKKGNNPNINTFSNRFSII